MTEHLLTHVGVMKRCQVEFIGQNHMTKGTSRLLYENFEAVQLTFEHTIGLPEVFLFQNGTQKNALPWPRKLQFKSCSWAPPVQN